METRGGRDRLSTARTSIPRRFLTSCVAESWSVRKLGPSRERQLHDFRIRLAGTNNPFTKPRWNAPATLLRRQSRERSPVSISASELASLCAAFVRTRVRRSIRGQVLVPAATAILLSPFSRTTCAANQSASPNWGSLRIRRQSTGGSVRSTTHQIRRVVTPPLSSAPIATPMSGYTAFGEVDIGT